MAQSIIGALSVRMSIDSAAFEKGITELQKSARKLERNLQKTARKMQSIGTKMSIGLTAPLVAIGAQALKTSGDYREAMAQVEAGLTSMGNVSGRTMADLKKQADALQGTSLFTKQDILNGVTSNLLTFGNVAGEQFDRAQQAALDLSARLEQDLKSSTVMIGKALNDPVLGITAMSRAGIQFTEDQKAMIKGMVKMGDTAGAQSIILAELERQFAGSAQAAQDAAPGDEIMDPWNDFKIILGDIIFKVLPPLTEAIGRALGWFNKLSAGTQKNIIVVAALVAAIGPLVAIIGTLVGVFAPLIAAVVTLAGAGGFVAVTVALGGLLAPFAAVIAAVTALTTAYFMLSKGQREANKARGEYLDLLERSKALSERARANTLDQARANLIEAQSIREATKAKIEDLKVELQRRRELAEKKANKAGGRLGLIGASTTAAGVTQAESDLRVANESLEINAQKTQDILDNIERIKSLPVTDIPVFTLPKTDKEEKAEAKALADALKVENAARKERLDLYQQEYEAEIARIQRLDELKARHEANIQAIRDEVAANHEIAEAYKISRKEGELVARTLQVMADNARLTRDAARDLAAELIASEDAVAAELDKLDKKAKKSGDTMADAFKRGADSFSSLVNALKSGDIGGILQGIMGVATELFGKGGGTGSGGGSLIKSIGGFLGFEGGGHTGSGARSGGIDGRGGFMAMLHPNETVIDHTKSMRGLKPPSMPSLAGGAMPPIRIAVQANDYFDAKVVSTSAQTATPISQAASQQTLARAARSTSKRQARAL